MEAGGARNASWYSGVSRQAEEVGYSGDENDDRFRYYFTPSALVANADNEGRNRAWESAVRSGRTGTEATTSV